MTPDMFEALITRPILNVLIVVIALLPGHNLGIAIIIFTFLVRLCLYPLLKKQLHHTRAMRELQPELKKIKAKAKGDRALESRLTMELYKEREVNPFSSIGIILIQLPILIGLYFGLSRVIKDPSAIIEAAYEPVKNLSYMKELQANIGVLDATFLGVDLTRAASGASGLYWPAMIIAFLSAISQYFQSKQLQPNQGEAKTIRQILKEGSSGKKADQTEMNAAVSRFTILMIPGLVFFISIGLPAALPLYWLASSVIAYIQQARILKQDEKELIAMAEKTATITSAAHAKKAAKEKETPKPTPRKKKRR